MAKSILKKINNAVFRGTAHSLVELLEWPRYDFILRQPVFLQKGPMHCFWRSHGLDTILNKQSVCSYLILKVKKTL